MKLISWNMNRRRDNWTVLADVMQENGAVAAMVQEAVQPAAETASNLRIHPDPSLGDNPWHIPVPATTKRNFASAVVVYGDTPIEPWTPKPIGQAADGGPAISHPGQWVAVGIDEPETRLWIVSLYGIWDRMPDSGDIFAEATLHRALSDLALLFQAKATDRLVLAGDLNIWRGYGQEKWRRRYQTVFDRLEAYGLKLAGPHRTIEKPLEGCPCNAGNDCSHVRTYRHQHRKSSTPYQNDFVFARGVQVGRCDALDEERYWKHSDHCPLLFEITGT
jgi:hypothetical protein